MVLSLARTDFIFVFFFFFFSVVSFLIRLFFSWSFFFFEVVRHPYLSFSLLFLFSLFSHYFLTTFFLCSPLISLSLVWLALCFLSFRPPPREDWPQKGELLSLLSLVLSLLPLLLLLLLLLVLQLRKTKKMKEEKKEERKKTQVVGVLVVEETVSRSLLL